MARGWLLRYCCRLAGSCGWVVKPGSGWKDWGQEAQMRDLRGFREAVREHRRMVGRDQQQLARSIGLHPHVLSHKLNGHGSAVLTVPEVIGIATTLAGWGALVTRADVHALLELMDVPPRAIPDAAWSVPPLADLRADDDGAAASRAAPGPAPHPRAAASAAAPRSFPEAPAGRPQLALAPLPAPMTALVGRAAERAAAAAAVKTARLVTLTGAGGTGKTRLAVQVAGDLAGRFADGVAFADLALVSDPALLGTAAARAVGLAPRSAQEAEAELAGALRDRELLLVLDNLEHLLEGTGLLEATAGETPRFRMLQTVREYALARLAQTGDQDDARRRHLSYYLAVASDARGGLEGLRQGELLDELEAAYPNLQAALDFAGYQAERDGTCLDQGLRLATALGLFWTRRGPLAEGVLQLDRLLALDEARCTQIIHLRRSAIRAGGPVRAAGSGRGSPCRPGTFCGAFVMLPVRGSGLGQRLAPGKDLPRCQRNRWLAWCRVPLLRAGSLMRYSLPGSSIREATPAACSPAAWRAARPVACSARQERRRAWGQAPSRVRAPPMPAQACPPACWSVSPPRWCTGSAQPPGTASPPRWSSRSRAQA
jgi:hypothetical protein